jgi:hypothetical protein
VMVALQVRNIPTGPNDDIGCDASYAIGDTKEVISAAAVSGNFAIFGKSGVGAYRSIGLGVTTDAVWPPGTSGGEGLLKLTKSWGIRGAFIHNWDRYWSTRLFGTYATTAKGAYCHPRQGVTYNLRSQLQRLVAQRDHSLAPVENLTLFGRSPLISPGSEVLGHVNLRARVRRSGSRLIYLFKD